jgi:hypothetical protein
MSLSVVVRGPEGLVFAADSRSLLDLTLPTGSTIPVSFDATNNLLTFDKPHNFVAAVTYGLGGIGDRSVSSFVPEIEARIATEGRLSVQEYSARLSGFFMEVWDNRPELKNYTGLPITFLVGGFNEGELYGRAYELHIPFKPEPLELPQTGINWGGQKELVERLILGYDPALAELLSEAWPLTEEHVKAMPEIAQPLWLKFPLHAMGLQGYVDLAIFLIRTTIETQRLALYVRGCGGPIDVATITRRDGLRYVQRKEVEGESY